MKKVLIFILSLLMVIPAIGQDAKYVFYFIGDGMGLNPVNFTQYYKASVGEDHGTKNLLFAGFPAGGFATTWSADNQTTDSAASGTALACGEKTQNGALGLNADGKPLESVATKAKSQGKKVAIITTVGINHATPAAFYAHQQNRHYYDRIALDLCNSGFDYFAGSEMMRAKKDKYPIESLDWKAEARKAGYTVVSSKEEYYSNAAKASKILFIPENEYKVELAINRKPGSKSTTLSDFVSTSLDFLMKDGCRNGFFMMAEGGRIDGQAHGNDGASVVKEILDMEEAVAIAYQFYLKHPKETAIIVTSDHDTGGAGIRPDKFSANILQWQTENSTAITSDLKSMMKKETVTWEGYKKFISERTGLFTKINVTKEDEDALAKVFEETIAKARSGNVTDDFGYNNNAVIVARSLQILNSYAGITWTTRKHSSGFVPLYYIGPRAELFSGATDNAEISRNVAKITLK